MEFTFLFIYLGPGVCTWDSTSLSAHRSLTQQWSAKHAFQQTLVRG